MLLQPAQPFPYSGYLMAEKMVLLLGFFSTVAFLVWLMARHYRTRAEVLRLHLASRDKLITQAGSLDSLLAFARSPEGRSLLELPALATSRIPVGLRFIQAGIVCLSIALLRGIVAALWVQGLKGAGTDVALVNLITREGLLQALLYGGAGLGLILAGWLGRRVQARWMQEDDRG